ncbi:exodeoxyribonuclease VII large subunit [uncultured Paracoccus sp.]|uniref:exodeoxyribonuclease VII large subunit n=1 Tax=uncultured Paracoccus sp. TaxID=189685 RepID=UPI00262F6732|nr:exodeoxyribonuclease VII large subunit [uncultured Paracoccus sp.]
MDLFEDGPDSSPAPGNAPPLTVSEISGAIKRVIEGEFGRIRVRGEVGRVSRPGSGHLYFDLKDDRAVIAAVCWKATACRLGHRPEEGLEVIATGRLTTFPGQSRYQLLVEEVEPAGIGALMAMLEQRRRQLDAEGLFHPDRKRALPFLPGVIAVVTSPSGAVIRDILHRLRDRFPTRVLIYPVAVQGRDCAPQVATAIRALNAITAGGPVPRPDLIIVARGGGSIEDLWGFNEEAVVRAVAEGTIPLISAVGHETDTTLIDHVADLRAPTPTAAAELGVPVRADLAARLAEAGARMMRATGKRDATARQRLSDLARGLGRPQAATETARQRLDLTGPRLETALRGFVRSKRHSVTALDLPIFALRDFTRTTRTGFDQLVLRFLAAPARGIADQRRALPMLSLGSLSRKVVAERRRYEGLDLRFGPAAERRWRAQRDGVAQLSRRLATARARMVADARRAQLDRQSAVGAVGRRLDQQGPRITSDRRGQLDRLDRLRQTLGYTETLRRGFAVIRGPDGIVTSSEPASRAPQLQIEFHDGTVPVRPEGDQPRAKPRKPAPTAGQKTLF